MTHGIGSIPCGATFCGLGLAVETPARRVTAPAALAFDGPRKDFKLDDRGRYQGTHPVDAKVFNILRVVQGSIRSAPDVGQTVGAIRYIDNLRIRAQVEDRVRTALAPVVRAGEIRIRSIDIDTATRGRIMFAVSYVNLITGRPDTFRGAV